LRRQHQESDGDRDRAFGNLHARFADSIRNTLAAKKLIFLKVWDIKCRATDDAHVGRVVELGISEITVKAHRGQVMRKMKADSLADLVRMAARLRIQDKSDLGHVRIQD
jgi:hypothetical protein